MLKAFTAVEFSNQKLYSKSLFSKIIRYSTFIKILRLNVIYIFR